MDFKNLRTLLFYTALIAGLRINAEISNPNPPYTHTIPHLHPTPLTTAFSRLVKLPEKGPEFDPAVRATVTTLAGQTAFLTCRVDNLGNYTVSWIRHRDIHIISTGSYTFSGDNRIKVTHFEKTGQWILEIRLAHKLDEGWYECQISTIPEKRFFVHLDVIDVLAGDVPPIEIEPNDDLYHKMLADPGVAVMPSVELIGGPEVHVDEGSVLNLTCIIYNATYAPNFVFWFHQGRVVNHSKRPGITVMNKDDFETNTRVSNLLIENVTEYDSGKYTCSPTDNYLSNFRVHVNNGGYPAARQNTIINAADFICPSALIILTVYVIM